MLRQRDALETIRLIRERAKVREAMQAAKGAHQPMIAVRKEKRK